jgi:2-polyprenyl-3-methyl-5-hydroxy-6-metoxy-1,4-benzoquinol methylase
MVPGEWSTTTADHSGRLYASNVNRKDVSVEDAVVDLLILARSQIVRTSHSTFLNTALLLKQAGAEYPPVVTAETNRFSVDMPSLDRYFQSHFEYFGHPIQVDISSDQHTRLFTRLQEQWTDYGANSPYTSVLSDEKYLMSRIEENRDEFNESGETPVTWFQTLAARNDIKIPKGSCFELGCGVGRVTKPLAGIFDRVVAGDISPGNLALCKSYMQQSHLENVETILLQSPDDVERVEWFDVFFSIIVLQHNPPPIQYYLLDQILGKVNQGGLCYFQTLTYNPGYAYSVDAQLALDKQAFEQWSIHCLPMRYIMELMIKHDFMVLEIIQDGLARGLQNKFHSHTFFAKKQKKLPYKVNVT